MSFNLDSLKETVPLGIYSHYKDGTLYLVFDYILDSDDDSFKIVYRRLNGTGEPKYVKSLGVFTEDVSDSAENKTGQKLRFGNKTSHLVTSGELDGYKPKSTIGYIRESVSNVNGADMGDTIMTISTQLIEKGHIFELVADIGESDNCDLENYKSLIRGIVDGYTKRVFMMHNETLTGDALKILQIVSSMYGCRVTYLNT